MHPAPAGAIPQFKWGQDHYELFVTVFVPALEKEEVRSTRESAAKLCAI